MSNKEDVEYVSSIIERSNRFGVPTGKTFRALSNFKVDIDGEVADGNNRIMGYVSTVTLYNGECLG